MELEIKSALNSRFIPTQLLLNFILYLGGLSANTWKPKKPVGAERSGEQRPDRKVSEFPFAHLCDNWKCKRAHNAATAAHGLSCPGEAEFKGKGGDP